MFCLTEAFPDYARGARAFLKWVTLAGILGFLISTPCHADLINIGLISFDPLIPGDGNAPGVDVFSVSNFTGDPAGGGFALPPDFPVFSDLVFQDSMLTVMTDTTSETISLGDLGSGSFTPDSLEFSDTIPIQSAIFTATLNASTIELYDGTFINLSSPNITAFVLPLIGSQLTPDSDFALIVSAESPSGVPEPRSEFLIGTALVLLTAGRSARRVLR